MAEYHPRIIDVSSVPHPRTGGPVLPRWSDVLRGLREARGVTQEGWAAILGYGRATVHRWERGEAVPGPDAVEALVRLAREQGLLRHFERGRLGGLTLTAELLRELLAEARASGGIETSPRRRRKSGEGGPFGEQMVAPRPDVRPLPSPGPRHNLPLPLSSFLGREAELAAVAEILRDARLVTLTGAGGCGKSRLAVEVGRALLDDYPDGVWLVELAPLADPALVPYVVGVALGIAAAPGESPVATLVAALKSRRLLLLMDNCEHILEASARLAEAVLQQCPGVRILATSREALGIAGEVRWPVPPLAVPPDGADVHPREVAQYAAVRLFVERAKATQPTFAEGEQAGAIAHVCRRLDGMPLAIELAAALTPVLSAEQIAARLDRRFGLLTGGSRTALPRQRTLRAAIDWSYDLLVEPERRLLRRLAVFAGGWALEAAEAVCLDGADDVFDVLSRLVAKSLVQVDDGAGHARYRLLETIQAYARERLKEDDDLEVARARHAAYYLRIAGPRLRPPPERGPPELAITRLAPECHNLLAALDWCQDHDRLEATLQLGAVLASVWLDLGAFSAGRAQLAALLELARSIPPSADTGSFLSSAGELAYQRGDYSTAYALVGEALAINRRLGDRLVIARTLCLLGPIARERGDGPTARTLLEEGLAIYQELGNLYGIGAALVRLGETAHAEGDYPEAQRYYQASLPFWARLGLWPPRVSHHLGTLALDRGDLPEARRWFVDCLTRQVEQEHGTWSHATLADLACLAAAQGHATRALRLAGAVEAQCERAGAVLQPTERGRFDRWLEHARRTLGDARSEVARAEGDALSPEQAITYALEEDGD